MVILAGVQAKRVQARLAGKLWIWLSSFTPLYRMAFMAIKWVQPS
jgi:hypothetical protein